MEGNLFNGNGVSVLQDESFRDLLQNNVHVVNTTVLYT